MIDIIASFAVGVLSGVGGMIGASALAWKQRDRVVAWIAKRPSKLSTENGDYVDRWPHYTTPED